MLRAAETGGASRRSVSKRPVQRPLTTDREADRVLTVELPRATGERAGTSRVAAGQRFWAET